jgi:hypothetical protein
VKKYEADYEDAMATLTLTLQKREQLDEKIESLTERIDALETLIRNADPHKAAAAAGRFVIDQSDTSAQVLVNHIKPQVTQRVRGLLDAAGGPLTCAEINDQLHQLGWQLGPDAQPLALIFGIGRRLVQQGFAVLVEKNGRKAWVRARSK